MTMQKPSTERKNATVMRTLQTLQLDLQRFIQAGADVKKAKFYNNVLYPYMFDIPLSQVSNT